MSKIQHKNWDYDKDAPKTMRKIESAWCDKSKHTPLARCYILNSWEGEEIALSIPYSAELEVMYEQEKKDKNFQCRTDIVYENEKRNLLETNQRKAGENKTSAVKKSG